MIVQTSPLKPGTSQQLSYPVIVGRNGGDRWMARLLGWGECWARGTTRDWEDMGAAIAEYRQAIETAVSSL